MNSLDEETQQKIQAIANKNNVAIIGFIAPQDAVRVSPVTFARAQITESDMYRLEEIVRKIKGLGTNCPNTLHLVIQTPGGELFTSYKIAYYLRKSFKKIKVYVPYQAASGGTILCCAADEICLGELGNLTPIDPQLNYHGNWISAHAFQRSVNTLQSLFGDKTPEEVPTPWQQFATKIDPVIFDEMSTIVFTTFSYARELLLKSGYELEAANSIAWRLARPDTSHAHPILGDNANELGFHIITDNDNIEIYGKYVSARLKERSSEHIIEHFLPSYENSNPTNTIPGNQSQVETPAQNAI